MNDNPYRPPHAEVADVASGPLEEAEATRREHLNHEASVRAIGTLYYLAGIGMALFASLAQFGQIDLPRSGVEPGAGLLMLLFTALYFWIGWGLRRLKHVIRIPAGLLTGLGLLAFPVGTLISAYILYLLFSRKGRMVFSADYRQVREATPHIKYRTSIIVWLLVAVVVLGIAAVILIPMLAGRG